MLISSMALRHRSDELSRPPHDATAPILRRHHRYMQRNTVNEKMLNQLSAQFVCLIEIRDSVLSMQDEMFTRSHDTVTVTPHV